MLTFASRDFLPEKTERTFRTLLGRKPTMKRKIAPQIAMQIFVRTGTRKPQIILTQKSVLSISLYSPSILMNSDASTKQ